MFVDVVLTAQAALSDLRDQVNMRASDETKSPEKRLTDLIMFSDSIEKDYLHPIIIATKHCEESVFVAIGRGLKDDRSIDPGV